MRTNAKNELWMPMEIRGIHGWFSDMRIVRDSVPEWMCFWELADGDCDGEPCRYRRGILVNFYGTFLTTGILTIDDKSWIEGYIREDDWEIKWDKSISFKAVIKEEMKRMVIT